MDEFSPALLPALEQEVRLRSEIKEEGEWILHVDGSSNVRGAGKGIVLTLPTGSTASRAVRGNFKATNNESEYEALIASPKNVKEVQKLTGRMAALSRFISRLSDKSHAFFGTVKNPKDFQWTGKCESALQELKSYLTTPPLLSKPLLSEVVLLYLAVSEHAVSSVLVREDGNKQLPIYYVSKALLDAETRYSHLENLALALIVAARKLRSYFQAHPIMVVTSFPIKFVLRKPEVSGRTVELGEYDVIFRPATAIQSQVLADFVAEFSPALLPNFEQEVRLRGKIKEEGE